MLEPLSSKQVSRFSYRRQIFSFDRDSRSRVTSLIVGSVLVGAFCLFSVPTKSSELVFGFQNPSFGGNPLNASHLLGLADRQNQFLGGGSSSRARDNQAEAFVRSLQSRLLSSLATEVDEAIFGENPQDQGTIVFGDTTVSFQRGLEFIDLVITDPNGVTEIQVPVLQVE